MEQLPNGYTLAPAEGAFPLSTDSMVLSHFAKLPKNARVLDLGSGCGTLGLLLCSKNEYCQVTGIELSEQAHAAASENIRRNKLDTRMESICADLRSVSEKFSPGSFSCCISNPPYFSGGPASQSHPTARREDHCTPDDLFRSAAWALKYGGDFFLVHKPERLAELIAKAAVHKLEAKRLLLLRHKENGPITLIFLQFRKGAHPSLKIEEKALFSSNNEPTSYYKEIYHIP
ncbi:MAG: methyltransferase [Oscillospiraceae bacterium]|nr:methyltransferase [Oscillospiraceae bacterium]